MTSFIITATWIVKEVLEPAEPEFPEVLPPEAGELFPFDDEKALARAIVRAGERLRSGALTPEGIRAVYDSRYGGARFQDAWTTLLNGLRS